MTSTHTDVCLVVLTAPSGSGKTSIAAAVMKAFPQLHFSISVTTRPPRPHERHGVEYYFVSEAEFRGRIEAGDLLEYEEVYPGRLYGTLCSEVERSTVDSPVLLDIEVKGASNVKRLYGADAFCVFIRPPSIEVLEERLRKRGTETEATLAQRLLRAKEEMTYADRFDAVVVNDNLDEASERAIALVQNYLERR